MCREALKSVLLQVSAVVSVALFDLAVLPTRVLAAVPDPDNSTCAAAVSIGSGGCCFDIVVRDLASNPIAGATVVIEFDGCAVTFCTSQPPGLTVDADAKTAMVVTDAQGVARFCICGSFSGSCMATVFADGVHLCTIPVSSCGGGTADGFGVSTPVGDQLRPRITTDGAGGAIIVWRDTRGTTNDDIYVQHVLSSGVVDTNWPVDGRALCTAIGTQSNPVIASDGVGGAFVAWEDSRGATIDIYAHHVLASGVPDPDWPTNGLPVCTAALNQGLPTIVAEGPIAAIIAWADARGGGDIYAQRVLGPEATVDPDWPINGAAVCTATGVQGFPVSVPDLGGGSIIAWQDGRSGGGGDIYAQLLMSTGEPEWLPNGIVVCDAAGSQTQLSIAEDGSGGGFVVWTDARNGNDDIYGHHLLFFGLDVGGFWLPDGVPVCDAPLFQREPVAARYMDGAIVAWKDNRAGAGSGFTYDIYAHHLLGNGALDGAWPSGGRALCTAPDNQEMPVIAEIPGFIDGPQGGAIVAWQDRRNGVNFDIYARSVLASGVVDPSWPPDGLPVSTAPDHQRLPVMVAGEPGIAIVAWQDRRSGTHEDVYAQRIGGSLFFQGAAHYPMGGASLVRSGPDTLRITGIGSSGGDGVRIEVPDNVSALGIRFDLPDESALSTGAYLEVSSRARGAAPAESLAVTRMTRLATPGQYAVTSTITGAAEKVVAAFSGGAEVYLDRRSNSTVIDAIIPRGLYSNDDLGTEPLSPLLLRWRLAGPSAVTIDNRPGGAPDTTVTADELRILEVDPVAGNFRELAEFRIRGKNLGEFRILAESSRRVGVTSQGATIGGLWLAPPTPNPSRGFGTFGFRLEKADRVSVEVTDVAGRRVESRGWQYFPAGSHTLRYPAPEGASGIYFVRLSTASGASMVRKWVVLR